jgi:hypothetical protein
MSERSVADIRGEIAAERQRLDDDLAGLRSELRSLAVFMAAGLVLVALVTWFAGRRRGARTVSKLVR